MNTSLPDIVELKVGETVLEVTNDDVTELGALVTSLIVDEVAMGEPVLELDPEGFEKLVIDGVVVFFKPEVMSETEEIGTAVNTDELFVVDVFCSV